VKDSLDILRRIVPRRRTRAALAIFGETLRLPGKEFLDALRNELSLDAAAPDYFSLDLELDALCAAFKAASQGGGEGTFPLVDDRRGFLEMDGFRFDAVLAYGGSAGTTELVLILSRAKANWSGRRMRRIINRLKHVFGNDGLGLSGAKPRLVLMSPERPSKDDTSYWPAWTVKADGSANWLPLEIPEGELRIQRCDKRGRRRRVGEYWRLVPGS